MTLRACKACGAQIRTKAATCPQCGHPQPKPTSLFTKIIGGFFAFMVFVAVVSGVSSGSREAAAPGAPNAPAPSPGAPAASTDVAVAPTSTNVWDYGDGDDGLRRGKWHDARTPSLRMLEFGFPYNNKTNHMWIVFRQSPADGKVAYLEVDHGQFMCHIGGCSITVRFDEGPVKRVSAHEAGSGQSEAIFLPYGPMLADIKKAKRMVVEAEFYKEGREQVEFDVHGLRWQ